MDVRVVTRALVGALGLLLCAASPARAGGESLVELVRSSGPSTAEGAPQVVQIYRELLLAPPYTVDRAARTSCVRYLPAAAERVRADGGPCPVRVAAREAMAMCRWFHGDDAAAREAARALALLRCPEVGLEGLERAMDLAERWLWPEPLRDLVGAQRGETGEANRRRLEEVSERRAAVLQAFGERTARRAVLVTALESGSPGARMGLRRGDVVISAAGRAVRSGEEMAALTDREASVPIVYLRAGRQLESTWRGPYAGIEGTAVPERLAGP